VLGHEFFSVLDKKKVKRSLGCCVPDSEVSGDNKTQTRSQNAPEKEPPQCLAISREIGVCALLWIAMKSCPLLTGVCETSGHSCWGARGSPAHILVLPCLWLAREAGEP